MSAATAKLLATIETIRASLATINAEELSAQVPEPPGDNPIASLARTINRTLRRLDGARRHVEKVLDQQRRFTADASHELRTPITALRAELEEARLHPDQTDLDELLGRALSNVDRLQAITTDLLLLTRIAAAEPAEPAEPAERENLDLAQLVQEQISQRADRHNLQVALVAHTNVNITGVQIGRVLAILLDNAQRHAESTVEVQVCRDGDTAALTVTDDGQGIAEANRERIFHPFARLDVARCRNHGGTGLGLAIARDIAHSHHGTLHVQRAPTGGARFVLRLPITEPFQAEG
jgi:signal transduction histidine kinase